MKKYGRLEDQTKHKIIVEVEVPDDPKDEKSWEVQFSVRGRANGKPFEYAMFSEPDKVPMDSDPVQFGVQEPDLEKLEKHINERLKIWDG